MGMGRVDAHWSGGYPTRCFGEWTIVVDGLRLTGIESKDFGTYGVYDTWYFDDNWSDVWEDYTDGELLEDWDYSRNGLKDSLVRHGIKITDDLIRELYEAISAEDWRHNSCGGCI